MILLNKIFFSLLTNLKNTLKIYILLNCNFVDQIEFIFLGIMSLTKTKIVRIVDTYFDFRSSRNNKKLQYFRMK